MTDEQLTGKYTRLRAELAAAYAEPDSSQGRTERLDRITTDLAMVERTLAWQRPAKRPAPIESRGI